MNIQNLNSDELKQLQTLLNKMNPLPTEKVYLDPVNKMIDDIMNEFDWLRVQRTMEFLDWKWAGEYVTIPMLQKTAKHLLESAMDARLNTYKDSHWEVCISSGTGGLDAKAWCDKSKTKIIGLELQFTLSHWEESIDGE